ncbi:MAG: CotH kinase family protein [Bacteroidaceae bacterium]|nr:CotH kinase family protein [Bacteroidaceae bacterium]
MNKITTLFFASLTSLSLSAKSWIDVTDVYVKNPRYDNNDYSYWLGTALAGANPKENAEHYNKTYNTYQALTGLSKGKYRVSLDAFYRMGSSSNDYNLYTSGSYKNYQYAKLYATSTIGDYEVGIAPSSSAALENSLGGGVTNVGQNQGWGWNVQYKYIPNNMEAAYYWFEAGYYDNSVECEVGDDGKLTIGIRKTNGLSEDWTCIDNWKLEYYGDVKNIESISFESQSIDIVLGGTLLLTPIIMPSDATYKSLEWSISNTKIATIDENGKLTATALGSTILTAASTDGSGVKTSIPVNVYKNTPSAENIIINEIMAANIDVYLDPNCNYGSWVEIYNPSDKGVNLGGLYISDDATNLKKHKLTDSYGSVPAHGYGILNFDHHEIWTEYSYRQIDDKLDCDGGTIIISDGTQIIAQQDYPQALGRISYARTSDGGNKWGLSGCPTPGASNVNGYFASEQLEAPVVDKDGQLFNGTIQVCVNIPSGATLKYTTDGTAPTLTNGEISSTGLFSVSSTTTYRFRLFKDGNLPSKVVTRSYIENNNNEPFPIISIVTDPDNIYSTDRGAFMEGPYGRPGNGKTSNCNWNMAWDYPVNFEFITTDNEYAISQECDFSMCGGWSRSWTPHAFKLKASKIYDLENVFEYQFFDEKPNLKHKVLQIRNGGNDTSCRIKDAAIQGVIASSGIYVDHQAWQPVHVYINGEPYAVLNMREPNNKDYAYSNYGIDSDEIEQFEMSPDSGYVQMRGTGEYFRKLYDLSTNAADKETYEEIGKLVDLDEYINYMAIELYLGNWDWPQNNVKGFRDLNDGKFHFVIFDMDGSLSSDEPLNTFFDKQIYTFDYLHGFDYSTNTSVEGTTRTREIEFVTLFLNMLENDDFRKRFIDAYCIVNGSVFTPERVNEIVSKMNEYLSQGNYVYPSSTANSVINGFSSNRQTTLINHLKNHYSMKLSSVTGQKANIKSNIVNGKIFLNDQVIPTGTLEGTVFAPIKLKAVAPAGFKFIGWKSQSSKDSKTIFATGETWKYYDKGSLDNTSWTSTSYSDNSWTTATAPLGYGKGQSTQTNSYNTTYYFRKTFTLSSTPQTSDEFTLNYSVDDGMIVYINGKEAGRYNMPSGNVNYNNVSTTYASGNPDSGTMTISSSLFKKGTNVIAVEVHNNSSTSSDIYWDANLTIYTESTENATYVSTDQEYTCPTSGAITLTAVWKEMTEEEMIAEGLNTSSVVINEISAANSVYVNDYFKKNDWIELYNTSSEDIDIAGLYISDNCKKPTKYQVPTDDITLNTVIPANGYKLIWCDKLDNISDVIHTSFKLAANGGDVMIAMGNANATADDILEGKNIVYSDTISYTTHTGIQSFGCYPDASSNVYILDIPTPGTANIYTSYAIDGTLSQIPDANSIATAYTKESGLAIAFVNGVINIKSENASIKDVNVYSVSGMKVHIPNTRSTDSFVTLNASSLPKGIYIAHATDVDGDECKVKFVIK